MVLPLCRTEVAMGLSLPVAAPARMAVLAPTMSLKLVSICFIVRLAMALASATRAMSSSSSAMSEVRRAKSAPRCMAMPTCAPARAGASFMPSPTKAIFAPLSVSSCRMRALSSGISWAW